MSYDDNRVTREGQYYQGIRLVYKQIYTVWLKSVEDIKQVSRDYRQHHRPGIVQITHSSGNGGGLTVSKDFLNRYAGVDEPLDVEYRVSKWIMQNNTKESYHFRHVFRRQVNESFGSERLLYADWLMFNPPYKLDDDLFEL